MENQEQTKTLYDNKSQNNGYLILEVRIFTGKSYEGTFWNDGNVLDLNLLDGYINVYICEAEDHKVTPKFTEENSEDSAYSHTHG